MPDAGLSPERFNTNVADLIWLTASGMRRVEIAVAQDATAASGADLRDLRRWMASVDAHALQDVRTAKLLRSGRARGHETIGPCSSRDCTSAPPR
jgi:hypothetical protein